MFHNALGLLPLIIQSPTLITAHDVSLKKFAAVTLELQPKYTRNRSQG